MTIVLSLTPQRLDYILNVLAQRPYGEVAAVIAEIQQQLAMQPTAPVQPNGHDTSEAADEQ